jgi:four helix bundle protein
VPLPIRSYEVELLSRQTIAQGVAHDRGWEFAAKIGIVLEEADETLLWLELIVAAGLLAVARVDPLLREANELVAIMAATRKSALGR